MLEFWVIYIPFRSIGTVQTGQSKHSIRPSVYYCLTVQLEPLVWFEMAVLIDGINSVFVWLRLDQIRNQKSKLEKNFGSNWMKRSRSNSTEKSTWNIWPDEISKEIIHAKSMTEDTKSLFGINSRSKNLCCVFKQSNELSVNAWSFRYPAKKVIQESWKKISI